MSDARTAQARLERLLHVIPAAMREEGAALADLAEVLETTEERIVEDIEEMTARAYHQPGGWPDDVQILVEAGRVQVFRAAGFERPTRLSFKETLCLALGLRGTAASAQIPHPEGRERLLHRAETYLGRKTQSDGGGTILALQEGDGDPEGIRETLLFAARERRPCALSYLKSGAKDVTLRIVHPYAIGYAEGLWYAVAHCLLVDGVRVFRVDRILAADVADGEFRVPDRFRMEDYLEGARLYHAAAARDVRVKYSPRIARWIGERARWGGESIEEQDDGGVVMRHRVSDPHWAVAHVLQYGSEAEILAPEDIRGLVREVIGALLE